MKIFNSTCQLNEADGGQYLENLATAYWYSEALFAALELDIFSALEPSHSLADLAEATYCKPTELERLLVALEALRLVGRTKNGWQNETLAYRYLRRDSAEYLGDFLLYRHYLQAPWRKLTSRISTQSPPARLKPDDNYEKRTFYYVRALDALARRKAREITNVLTTVAWETPILDIGGGASSLSRSLLKMKPQGRAVLLDLPEVLAAAQQLYPETDQWTGIERRPGDFRTAEFTEDFGIILMANILHIYAADEAGQLLHKAASLLRPGGILLVHDYFPDRRPGDALAKGALYDLNMMLNTYEGRCHKSTEVVAWLREAGLCTIEIRDLQTDSGLITARNKQ